MAFTKTEVNEMITAYKAAIKAAVTGQSYSMDTGQGRISVTRASLPQLERGLAYWQAKLDDLNSETDLISLEVHTE